MAVVNPRRARLLRFLGDMVEAPVGDVLGDGDPSEPCCERSPQVV
jgi:hypothetical protein